MRQSPVIRAIPALCLSCVLHAQDSLSLAEAVATGLRSHLQLQAAEARIASAEGQRLQASLKPNPRLYLQSENSRFHGTPAFVYARDADSFVYASQVLETAGKREKRTELFSAGVRRQELERDLAAYQLAYRVSSAYWIVVGAERTRGVLQESLDNFERVVQYHRDRVREGAMAEADLLRVQVEQERLALSVRSAAEEAARARILLFREMGLAQARPAVLTESLEDVRTVETLTPQQAVDRRIDLLIARQASEQAQRNITLQRANARPDPEVLLGYKRTSGFDTLMAGVQINLPLRNRNQGAISAATADLRAATASMQADIAAAEAEIQAARATYESRLSIVRDTFPPLRDKAAESSRIAQAAYREGGADLLRLLDAERVRIETDVLYYRALVDYQLAALELRSALGVLR